MVIGCQLKRAAYIWLCDVVSVYHLKMAEVNR